MDRSWTWVKKPTSSFCTSISTLFIHKLSKMNDHTQKWPRFPVMDSFLGRVSLDEWSSNWKYISPLGLRDPAFNYHQNVTPDALKQLLIKYKLTNWIQLLQGEFLISQMVEKYTTAARRRVRKGYLCQERGEDSSRGPKHQTLKQELSLPCANRFRCLCVCCLVFCILISHVGHIRVSL